MTGLATISIPRDSVAVKDVVYLVVKYVVYLAPDVKGGLRAYVTCGVVIVVVTPLRMLGR